MECAEEVERFEHKFVSLVIAVRGPTVLGMRRRQQAIARIMPPWLRQAALPTMIVPGGMSRKEFFFNLANAQWIAAFNQRYENSATKEVFIVTSKVCAATLARGEDFADSNRPAIAFDSAALKFVNLDASRTGGIVTVWTTGAAR